MDPIMLPERLKQKLTEIAQSTDMLQRQGNALVETFLEAKGLPLDTKYQMSPDFSALLPQEDPGLGKEKK